MWKGWNASGEWVPVAGTAWVVGALVYGTAAAAPLVAALFLLRSWTGLAVIVVAMLAISINTASFFETSTSSTAAFAWFGPLVYGLPIVALVAVLESVGEWALKSARGRRR